MIKVTVTLTFDILTSKSIVVLQVTNNLHVKFEDHRRGFTLILILRGPWDSIDALSGVLMAKWGSITSQSDNNFMEFLTACLVYLLYLTE